MKAVVDPATGWKYQLSVERPSHACWRSGRPASTHSPVPPLTMGKDPSAARVPTVQDSS